MPISLRGEFFAGDSTPIAGSRKDSRRAPSFATPEKQGEQAGFLLAKTSSPSKRKIARSPGSPTQCFFRMSRPRKDDPRQHQINVRFSTRTSSCASTSTPRSPARPSPSSGAPSCCAVRAAGAAAAADCASATRLSNAGTCLAIPSTAWHTLSMQRHQLDPRTASPSRSKACGCSCADALPGISMALAVVAAYWLAPATRYPPAQGLHQPRADRRPLPLARADAAAAASRI